MGKSQDEVESGEKVYCITVTPRDSVRLVFYLGPFDTSLERLDFSIKFKKLLSGRNGAFPATWWRIDRLPRGIRKRDLQDPQKFVRARLMVAANVRRRPKSS